MGVNESKETKKTTEIKEAKKADKTEWYWSPIWPCFNEYSCACNIIFHVFL